MIAGLNGSHTSADFHNDSAALVTENGGKQTFGIFSRERVGIGVTDAAGSDLQ